MSQVSRNLLVQWRRGMLSRNGSPTREAKCVHRNSSQVLRGPRTNDIDLGWGFQKFPWGNYTDLWSKQPNGHCGFTKASYWQLFQTNAIGSTLFKEQLFFLPSVRGTVAANPDPEWTNAETENGWSSTLIYFLSTVGFTLKSLFKTCETHITLSCSWPSRCTCLD